MSAAASQKKTQDDETIERLQKQYGGIAHARLGGQLLVFRAPSGDEWEDYQEALKKKRLGVANRELAQVVCVYPENIDVVKPLFERYAGSLPRITDAIGDLAGADLEVTVKKG